MVAFLRIPVHVFGVVFSVVHLDLVLVQGQNQKSFLYPVDLKDLVCNHGALPTYQQVLQNKTLNFEDPEQFDWTGPKTGGDLKTPLMITLWGKFPASSTLNVHVEMRGRQGGGFINTIANPAYVLAPTPRRLHEHNRCDGKTTNKHGVEAVGTRAHGASGTFEMGYTQTALDALYTSWTATSYGFSGTARAGTYEMHDRSPISGTLSRYDLIKDYTGAENIGFRADEKAAARPFKLFMQISDTSGYPSCADHAAWNDLALYVSLTEAEELRSCCRSEDNCFSNAVGSFSGRWQVAYAFLAAYLACLFTGALSI